MKTVKDYSLRISQMFLYCQMGIAITATLIGYINDIYEVRLSFTVANIFDKLGIITACMILIQVNKKRKSPLLNYIVAVAISVLLFELYSFTRPKYMSYIWFLLLHSYADSMCLFSGLSYRVILGIHISTFLYHITRLVIFAKYDKAFPIFNALILFINFLDLDTLHLSALKCYFKLLYDQESMIKDFNSLIDMIPTPLVIYASAQGRSEIKRSNQFALQLFPIEKITNLIQESLIITLNHISSYSFHGRKFTLNSSQLKTTIFGDSTFVISILDITEVTQHEKQIACENAKWLFVNSINHQIKTPLSGIESSISLLEGAINSHQSKENISNYFVLAHHSINDLRHIVDDSVLFCEDKENGIQLKQSNFEIDLLFKDLEEEFYVESYSKDIVFMVKKCSAPFVLIGDRKRLFHILYTLTSNAFKYTLNGSISINYDITDFGATCELIIEITDTGIGMSQEEQCSVFRPFDFSENQIHAAKVSTGLGLHIAKRLCEKMNGSIRLISTPGKGTIVKVKVTLDIIPIELPYFQEHQQIPKLSNIAKVLVVDDNTTNIFVLKAMLTKIAVECDDAHNGQEAVSKYEKLPYALVLMDINMPIMNGYEASKAIRAKAAKECWPVTIVAVSAQDEPRKESDLSNFGIDKWVEKPMKIDCLKEMLKYSGIFESSSNNKCAK